MILNQVDNFFERIDIIYSEIKKIKMYSFESHPQYQNINTSKWPGFRSLELGDCNPIFKYLCVKFFFLHNLITQNSSVDIYAHERLKNNQHDDFIHRDTTTKHTILIYVSPTNLDSGTKFYNENDQIINDIKFVQNRLIFFDGRYKHSAYGHHGDNKNNSRITLNAFIK
jgi:hypothetical protein